MALLKQGAIPIGRMLFIPKEGDITKDDLEIESSGQYQINELPDRFVIKKLSAAEPLGLRYRRKDNQQRSYANSCCEIWFTLVDYC